jgi:multimeric flavodoxin WrbA
MKLLGLSAGRKLGSNEILVKEALMAAEEVGVEVAFIRLLDLNIKPCTGCSACYDSLRAGGAGKCIQKDDFHFLDDQVMECDGLILASPIFVLTPAGLVKDLCDRFGPSHDVTFRRQAKKIRAARGITKGEGPDERSFKKRVGGFITVGGATTSYPLSLGLPLMNLFTFSMKIKNVDQMQVMGITTVGHVIYKPEALARARKLGRNVAEAMKKPIDEVKWMGDELGTCPACHSNLLIVTKKNPVMCPICGIKGELKTDDDRITVTFSENELKRARVNIGGEERWAELDANARRMEAETKLKDYKVPIRLEGLKKYKGYREIHLNKSK